MKIKILLFAQLKEAYESNHLWLNMPDNATIREACNQLMSEEKKLSDLKDLPLRYAVNEEFQPPEKILCDGDSLALLSPVAGG